jgi:hypothetical protein
MKNKIPIAIFFIGAVFPFIFLNDFFPFARFGMFAEPVLQTPVSERFMVICIDKYGKKTPFDFAKVGFPTKPEYLLRNYFYRQQAQQLLKNLHQISGNPFVITWQLLQIQNRSDTISTTVFKP